MTKKVELFCQEYLIDCCGTAAAKRAGFSAHTANEQAAQMLATEEVSDRIGFLMEERFRRVGVNQDFVLNELVTLARVGEGMSRVRALELLGKHLHLFNDRVDVNITLAKKAEEYAAMPIEKQVELMREEIKRLEGKQ